MEERKKDSSEDFLSISEFTAQIKSTLLENMPTKVTLKGEISNLSNSGGHYYFSLKDALSTIRCIVWASSRIDKKCLSNGNEIIATGKLDVYVKGGSYSFVLYTAKPTGKGSLALLFEKWKKEFNEKGYFSPEIKKQIKNNNTCIGILTSIDGAALQDMLAVFQSKRPNLTIFVIDCRVQGENCSKELRKGIRYLEKWSASNSPKLDLIALVRGGGSKEDLNGFNQPDLIEAMYQAKMPLISAVGHEIDTSLSDYVADKSFITPTACAEGLVIDYSGLSKVYKKIKQESFSSLRKYLKNIKDNVEIYKRKLEMNDPNIKLEKYEAQNQKILDSCANSIDDYIFNLKSILNNYKHNLNAFDPKSQLKNGYCLIIAGDRVVKSKKQLSTLSQKVDKLKIMFKDGEIEIDSSIF